MTDFSWVHTIIKTNQLHLNIFTDYVNLTIWSTSPDSLPICNWMMHWLTDYNLLTDWLYLTDRLDNWTHQIDFNYYYIWLTHLSGWLNESDRLNDKLLTEWMTPYDWLSSYYILTKTAWLTTSDWLTTLDFNLCLIK